MKPYFFKQSTLRVLLPCLCALAAGLTSFASHHAHAQTALPLPPPPEVRWPEPPIPEPERWTQEDVTLEQQFETARKETIAAHQEAVNVCKTLYASEQAECLLQAKTELESELAKLKAKARFGIPPN